ncbi:MAG: RNA-guided pseudouridylation complex pseudouridine synthase subunit Cbf5 [Thermoplasmata archaeon]
MLGLKYVRQRISTVSPYGESPQDRSIGDIIPRSLVVIDKPSGPTSHQVSSWTQDICGMKAGHSGTLDPNVTGVIPMGIGHSVRVMDLLHSAPKEYVVAIKFHNNVGKREIASLVEDFTGEIYQMPPLRSGVKRRLRTRIVHEIEILDRADNEYLLRVRCQSGTYVRTLCKDMGKATGTGAHMMELRRTEAGGFVEDDCCTLQDLKDAFEFYEQGDASWLSELLLPYERALKLYPCIKVKDTAAGSILNGADLAAPGILEADHFEKNDQVVLYSTKGEGLAIGDAIYDAPEMIEKEEGLVVQTHRVFQPTGNYPRLWKEHK